MKRFNTLNGLQNYIRKVEIPDCFKLQGVIYTMDYYDMDGEQLTYGNKRTWNSIEVETINRYKSTEDATVTLLENCTYYDHIEYID